MTDTKPYGCSVCGRKFGRGEHLRRHASAHGTVKPFQCNFCQKRFARKYFPLFLSNSRDVLYRHYACCEVARAQSSLPKIETRRACDRCKKFKSRCSGGIPCERCRQASHVCTISKVSRQSETIPELSQDDRSPTTTSTVSHLGEDSSMMKESSLDESKQFPSG